MHPPLKKIENESSLKKEIKASKKSRQTLSFVRRASFCARRKEGCWTGDRETLALRWCRARTAKRREISGLLFSRKKKKKKKKKRD